METALVFLIIIGVIALVIGGIFLAFYVKKKRREAFAALATQFGLQYSPEDPYGLPHSYDFNLFAMGEGRGAENVLTGTWKDMDVIAADYWYYTTSTDSKGNRTRSYSYFTVVIVPLSGFFPKVSVTSENIFTRLADHIGLEDINFESEEFNRRYNIKSKHREFAFQLIDARMIEWFLAQPKGFSIETGGPAFLVYTRRRKPFEIPPVMDHARAFWDQVPRLVWEEYGRKAEPETGA